MYDPLTKGQFGLFEKPESLAAYLHDVSLNFINNEEQTREQLCLIHTDPSWSQEVADLYILNEEMKSLSQYNEYFETYNDIVNECYYYHYVEPSEESDADSQGSKMNIDVPPYNSHDKNVYTHADSESPRESSGNLTKDQDKSKQAPKETPSSNLQASNAEIIYSQLTEHEKKEEKKYFVSAIEIPLGNYNRSLENFDKSPIDTCTHNNVKCDNSINKTVESTNVEHAGSSSPAMYVHVVNNDTMMFGTALD